MINVNRVPLIERVSAERRERFAFRLAGLGFTDKVIDKALHIEGPHFQSKAREPRVPLVERVPATLRNRVAYALAGVGVADSVINKTLHLETPRLSTTVDPDDPWGMRELQDVLPAGAILGEYGPRSGQFDLQDATSEDIFAAPDALPAGAVMTGNGWGTAYIDPALRGSDSPEVQATLPPRELVSIVPSSGVIDY
jgi:hypothetical protein